MKLWIKLSLATILVLLFTTGLSGVVTIWHTARYHEQKTLEQYEQLLHSTALALGMELEHSGMRSYSAVTKNAYLNYLMQKYGPEQFILLCDQQIVCNLTPFDLHPAPDDRWNSPEAKSVIQKSGEQYILITGQAVPDRHMGNYTLVLVQDISDQYADIRQQALLTGGLCLGGALLAVFLLFVLTRKILAPLQSLRQAAEHIRQGKLHERVHVHTDDEVGIVANAFNAMAEQIEAQLTALSQLSEQRRQMLGSLAHELKTPMTSIIGYTDTLLHVNVKEEQQKRALTHIYQESRRLERLSSKLMRLIGMYDNESISFVLTDMSALFAHIKELEQLPLAQKQLTLHTSCHMEPMLLDPDLFESLLINLIDNSAKASCPGSRIELIGEQNRIWVKDSGHGIPRKELGRVTEAFYMADKARSRKEGGCGLGLSLCTEIARLHGARLVIESKEGVGTRVSVLFSDSSKGSVT